MALISLGDIQQGKLAFGSHLVDDEGNHKGGGIARNPNRQAQFTHEIQRNAAYLYDRARNDGERAAILKARDEELEQGPSFTRTRKGSAYVPPIKFTLDGNEAVRIRTRLMLLMKRTAAADREAAKTQKKSKMSRTIPRGCLELLDALIALAKKHRNGDSVCLYPSLERLGGLMNVDADTVTACLKVLVFYGILTVQRRIKKISTALGFRTVQATNSYVIHSKPATAWGAMAFKMFGIFTVPNYSGAIKNKDSNQTLIGASETDDRSSPYEEPIPNGLAAALQSLGDSIRTRNAAKAAA